MPITVLYEIVGAAIIAMSCFGTCLGRCCCDTTSETPAPRLAEDEPLLVDQETAESNIECSVCLEPFDYGQVIRLLPCGHYYHAECYTKWEDRNEGETPCPLCRSTQVKGQLAGDES